ncbi:MAG: hypothetical protein IPN15_17625 [Saprospiraceae bacterium]|nr:hypothetical protein [Candidatus Vicinibacter affinis]
MSTGETTPAITVSPNTNTLYTVTVTDAIGCSATASTTVTILPRPLITVSATPTSVCKSGTSNLLATISNPVYAVSSIAHAPVALPGLGVTSLVTNGVEIVPVSSGSLDDGYWSGISSIYI